MSQTNEHNIPHLAKEIDWRDKYFINFYTQRRNVVSPEVIEEMAKCIVKWANEDEAAMKLSQYYLSKGIPSSTFHYLVNKHPVLKTAVECAKELIGNRREIGGLTNKLNANLVMSQMYKYDSSWWKGEVKRAELRAKTQLKADPDTRYAIVVEDFSKLGVKTDNLPEEE